MELHPEVMPEAQRRVLRQLGGITAEHRFYLAGGTAIAIWLGHRESVDLDWFTGREITEPLGLAQILTAEGLGFEPSGVARGTLHGTAEDVKLSFLEFGLGRGQAHSQDVGRGLCTPPGPAVACMRQMTLN